MGFKGKNIELWGEDIPWLAGFREKTLRAFEKQDFLVVCGHHAVRRGKRNCHEPVGIGLCGERP